MARILLIEPDPARAAALAAALGGGGAEVRIAPDGFYALTAIERERPDLVVAGGRVGGLGVAELAAILRSDPALAGIRLALYHDPAAPPADLNGGGLFDLVLDAAAPPGELAARLRQLAVTPVAKSAGRPPAAARAPAPVEPAAPAAPAPARGTAPAARPSAPGAPAAGGQASGFATAELPAPRPRPGRSPAAPELSGSLGVLNLMELSQALSLASKTGQLHLDCPRGEGCIYFELGKVVHATIRDRTGREAFSEILHVTLREKNIAFRFAPREPSELAAVPRSIDLTVQHLLLSFAVDLDETQDP